MPCEEKHNQILNFYILELASGYSYHKGQGTFEKWLDHRMDTYRGLMNPMFEMMKKLPPEQIASQMIYMQQIMQPLQEIEIDWIGDSEAVMRYKNCEILRRSRELVEKSGLDINPRFHCEIDQFHHAHPRHPIKDVGMELACELEENGCKWTFKLK
jgi:hypothetical protein